MKHVKEGPLLPLECAINFTFPHRIFEDFAASLPVETIPSIRLKAAELIVALEGPQEKVSNSEYSVGSFQSRLVGRSISNYPIRSANHHR